MRILKPETAGLFIDFQERLFPHIAEREELLRNSRILAQGLAVLDVPILVTQQYTKGLGETIPQIREVLPPGTVALEKNSFSCMDEPAVREAIRGTGKRFIVIAGIEAHVCVLQTVIDLVEAGLVPVVIADCVSSRAAGNRDIGLGRMEREGAVISCVETLLFELQRFSGGPQFKEISRLVK